MEEIKELDNKYTVVKWEDTFNPNILTMEESDVFRQCLYKISEGRKKMGKQDNRYVVLNLNDKIDITKLGLELCVKEHTPQKIEGDCDHVFLKVDDIAVDLVNAILIADNP